MRSIQEYFSQTSGEWVEFYRNPSARSYNYRARAAAALQLLRGVARRQGTGVLLEIGCGAGVQAAAASATGWQVVGVDLALPMLQQASANAPRGLWVVASAEALPFRTGTFDVVMMLGVLEYLPEPTVNLTGIRKAVRAGGYLVISSWANQRCLLDRLSNAVSALPDRVYLLVKRALTGRTVAPPPAAEAPTFINQYNEHRRESELDDLLRAAAWQPVKRRATNYGRFRFMGKQLWPQGFDEALSGMIAWISLLPGGKKLRESAMTAVVLARSDRG